MQTAVVQAQQQVRVAQAKLDQVQAGAKVGEINAQQASVERLEAQSQGDKTAQQEAIFRIEAQWSGDRIAQEARGQGGKLNYFFPPFPPLSALLPPLLPIVM